MFLLRCDRTRCGSPWGWVTRQPPRQATDPNPRILNSRKQMHGSTFYSQKRLRTSLIGAADVPLTHPALKIIFNIYHACIYKHVAWTVPTNRCSLSTRDVSKSWGCFSWHQRNTGFFGQAKLCNAYRKPRLTGSELGCR